MAAVEEALRELPDARLARVLLLQDLDSWFLTAGARRGPAPPHQGVSPLHPEQGQAQPEDPPSSHLDPLAMLARRGQRRGALSPVWPTFRAQLLSSYLPEAQSLRSLRLAAQLPQQPLDVVAAPQLPHPQPRVVAVVPLVEQRVESGRVLVQREVSLR